MAVPLRRCSSQNGSGHTPALTATLGGRRVGHCGKSKRAEFWIVTACFCTPSTSSHINHRPSPPSRSLGGGFPLPSNSHAPSNTHTQQSMRIHNRTLKCGFPIAPAHTKWDVSSDYQHCSLLASGASILDLFFFFFRSVLSMWAHKLTLSFQISISKLNTQKNVPLPSIHSKQAKQSELVAIKRFLLLCFQQLDAFHQ